MTLVGEAAAGGDRLQWHVLADKQPLGVLKPLGQHIRMGRVPEFDLEFPDKTEYAKLRHPGQFCQ